MLEREKFSTYLQKYNYDCGAGAAGIVLKNFGEHVNHHNLMQALNVRRDGTWPNKLEEYFKRKGFNVLSKEYSTITDLRREREKGNFPIVLYQGSGTKKEIAAYQGGHYSVVAAVTSHHVYLLDPGIDKDFGQGIGWQIIEVPEFRRRWTDRWKEKGTYVYSYAWMLSVGRPRRLGKT